MNAFKQHFTVEHHFQAKVYRDLDRVGELATNSDENTSFFTIITIAVDTLFFHLFGPHPPMYDHIDPNTPTEELLESIRNSATTQQHFPGLPLVSFATLLVKISREASATAEKNMIIQRRMIWITVIILGISIAQLSLAFFQFSSSVSIQQRAAKTQPSSIEKEVTKERDKGQNGSEQADKPSLPVIIQKQ